MEIISRFCLGPGTKEGLSACPVEIKPNLGLLKCGGYFSHNTVHDTLKSFT